MATNRPAAAARPEKAAAYAAAGVDIDLTDALKGDLKQKLRRTRRREVLGSVGGFGGLFQLNTRKYRQPVLVSSVDGVGTKLQIAVAMGRHHTIGRDLVNHCVNDIAVLGAEPLFFLDYVGMGQLAPTVFQEIIAGLADGCREAGCALVGGETAQMPGMYQPGDYDLVGSIVGVVDKPNLIDGKRIRVGDAIIGLASSGLHTNGYSLARQILFAKLRARLDDYHGGLGCTIGDELLKVHRNYWPLIRDLLGRKFKAGPPLHGLAHITGGGLFDNIPRVLPKGCQAFIRSGAWKVPPIFDLLHHGGKITEDEMYRVFNMGIGMALIVHPDAADRVVARAAQHQVPAWIIGEIRKTSAKPHVEIL